MGAAKIINKTDTAANWITINPVLADGEIGYETDTKVMKIGDGETEWNNLEGAVVAYNEVKLGSIIALPKAICYPNSLDFVADFNVDANFDATWGRGLTAGTPGNVPTATEGNLDLWNGCLPYPGNYVTYSGDLNASNARQTGCVRFKILSNYEGLREEALQLFEISSGSQDTKNLIRLTIGMDGMLHLQINDSEDSEIISDDLDYFSASSFQWREFELDWDITTGATRLFVDGIQVGSTLTSQGVRDGNIHEIIIGASGEYHSAFKVDKFRIYHTVMHTEDYMPDADGELAALPAIFSDYVACVGGTVDNAQSPYNGLDIPDMTEVDEDILWAWKVVE